MGRRTRVPVSADPGTARASAYRCPCHPTCNDTAFFGPARDLGLTLAGGRLMDDWQCLSEYVHEGSQSAFREVVARHVDLVYATCRRVVRDAHLAEDATQAVFVILAKKARTIRRHTSLVGWLHNTARYVSCNALRVAANRRRHEMEAAKMPRNKRDAAASN